MRFPSDPEIHQDMFRDRGLCRMHPETHHHRHLPGLRHQPDQEEIVRANLPLNHMLKVEQVLHQKRSGNLHHQIHGRDLDRAWLQTAFELVQNTIRRRGSREEVYQNLEVQEVQSDYVRGIGHNNHQHPRHGPIPKRCRTYPKHLPDYFPLNSSQRAVCLGELHSRPY